MSSTAKTISATDSPPRRPPWIPLSLRIFAGVLAILGMIGAVWLAVRVARHEATIRTFERIGGTVSRRPAGPPWIRAWPGGGWICRLFENVEDINLFGCPATDVEIEALRNLTGIKSVLLHGTGVTDEGLRHLAHLDSLESLYLSQNQITDVGILNLRQVPKLRVLYLGGTQVTDAGLERVARMTNLEWLDLTNTSASVGASQFDLSHRQGDGDNRTGNRRRGKGTPGTPHFPVTGAIHFANKALLALRVHSAVWEGTHVFIGSQPAGMKAVRWLATHEAAMQTVSRAIGLSLFTASPQYNRASRPDNNPDSEMTYV